MNNRTTRLTIDLMVLAGFCAFLFFFGLGAIGLVGADEPRYAQIAREMLARHDWVTPVLYGKPWLEKPILYYWEAMLSYSIFGVSDWAARVPTAFDATALVVAVYFFARRFLAGVALDAALITASCAFVIGFGHAASTDMPLTSTFAIAMLAWLAWHLGGRKLWLAAFYVFAGLGMLAKGPVAPVFAGLIIVVFAAVRRETRIVWRTMWLPGIGLFLAVVVPWYALVQWRTGNFFRVFLLEHNLARYGTNVYHHTQPFWYFGPVIVAAVLPWSLLAICAFVAAVRQSRRLPAPVARMAIPVARPASEAREITVNENHIADLNLVLVLWAALPVIFFSFSGSKLPGYILPAVPAFALLVAVYVRGKVATSENLHRLIILGHALIAGVTLSVCLMAAYIALRMPPPRPAVTIAVMAGAVVFAIVAMTLHRAGVRALRFITLLPVLLGMGFVLRLAAPLIDHHLSARPVARELRSVEPAQAPVAAYNVTREVEYGLAFYRNQPIARYERHEIPQVAHLLVAHHASPADLDGIAPCRQRILLGEFPPQQLEFYWVHSAAGCPSR